MKGPPPHRTPGPPAIPLGPAAIGIHRGFVCLSCILLASIYFSPSLLHKESYSETTSGVKHLNLIPEVHQVLFSDRIVMDTQQLALRPADSRAQLDHLGSQNHE